MPIHEGQLRFGFAGDGGVGENLIAQVIAGTKTATCLPTCEMTPEDLDETLRAAGRMIRVVDGAGVERCTIRISSVSKATFWDPTPTLVVGEGYRDDVASFHDDHVSAPIKALEAARASMPAAVLDAAWRIEPSLRLSFLLHDALGHSVAEIAALTGCPLATARQRVRRGRLRVAASMAAESPGAGCWTFRSSIGRHQRPELRKHARTCEACGKLVMEAGNESAKAGPPLSIWNELASGETRGHPAALDSEIVVVVFEYVPGSAEA